MQEQVDIRIVRARTALLVQQPFYGTLALYLIPKESRVQPTMATDGTHLYYNPAFLDTLTERKLVGCVAHGVLHSAMRHHTRRRHRDLELWNLACDFAINPILIDAKFELPDGILIDPKYKGMSAEQIYTILCSEQDQDKTGEPEKSEEDGDGTFADESSSNDDPSESDTEGTGVGGGGEEGPDSGQDGSGAPEGSGRPGKGQTTSGQGGGEQACPDPGGCGGVMDASVSGAETGEQEALWEQRVRQAANVAACGNVPAGLSDVLKELNRPQLDWREQLRRFINDRVETISSFSRPNKRMLAHGYIFPGAVADGVNHVAICRDTSGSCGTLAQAKFASELQSMLDEGIIQKITQIDCDCSVQHVAEYQKGDQIELRTYGGGGTAFRPALDWVAKNAPDASCIVYLTDLECYDFGEEPLQPVIWVRYGRFQSNTPFGEIVDLLD
jgi:predicted metal-dependent peptidase